MVTMTLVASVVLSQAYEGQPCEKANPELNKQLEHGKVPFLSQGITGDWAAWSTSWLKAEGRPPHKRVQNGPGDDLLEGIAEYDRWTCQHTAQALTDLEPKTAWCEGVKGEGIGELVAAPVDVTKPVFVWGGLGASAKLYAANARPKKVRVWLLHTSNVEAGQTALGLKDLLVEARHEVELLDQNGYQPLPLPKLEKSPTGQYVVALEILAVFPGGKYGDTCVSELGNQKAK